MPVFRYEVRDKNGKTMIGAMDAPSESEVRQQLITRGYTVDRVVPSGSSQPQAPRRRVQAISPQATSGPTSRASAPPKELAVFFRGLASYLKAGVTIHQALAQFGNQTANRGMQIICGRMAGRIEAGEKLSDAMTEFPRAFPPHVVGVVAAGELGGFLPIMVGDIALDYELAQRASSRWIRYGTWLLWVNALLPLPLAPFPILLFSPGVTDLATGVMRGVNFSLKYVVVPLVIIIVAYFVAAAVLRQPGMRPLAHRMLLKVPWAGRASRERSLATFARILWRLQSAGILPINAWDAASRSAENWVIAVRLHEQLGAIRSGGRFSDALAATRLFTSEDQRVLATGEATGQTADILQRIAAYYEDAAMASVGRARWLGLRMAILASLVSLGIVTICILLAYPSILRWIDWFFETGESI